VWSQPWGKAQAISWWTCWRKRAYWSRTRAASPQTTSRARGGEPGSPGAEEMLISRSFEERFRPGKGVVLRGGRGPPGTGERAYTTAGRGGQEGGWSIRYLAFTGSSTQASSLWFLRKSCRPASAGVFQVLSPKTANRPRSR